MALLWVVPGRVCRALVGALAVVLVASSARAESSPADIGTARRLFSESTELRALGKWEEAASKLREAIAIKETAGLRFHLAHCEAELGHLVLAAKDYDRADELIRGGANAPDVAALLEPARTTLRERIPSLRVLLPSGTAEATVSIDGAVIPPEASAKPIPVDPGAHTVDVTASARKEFRLELLLGEGDDRVVDVTLPPLAPRVPPAPAAPAPRRNDARKDAETSPAPFGAREVTLIGEGALAAGGFAMGVVFLAQRSAASDRVDAVGRTIGGDSSACSDPSVGLRDACARLHDALEERRDDGLLATVGFAAAGAFAAGAVVTWLVWPASPARAARVTVLPAPLGAVVQGAF